MFTRGSIFSFSALPRTLAPALFLFIFAVSALTVAVSAPVQAAENPRYASFVIDADTGAVLHQRYADKKLHPASLTKIMTLLMVFDAMHDGRLHMDDRIRITRHAASMQPSKIGLAPGATISVRDAIYALVTKSANDIAVAVAEHLGDSESRFAESMTRRARSIGMSRTTFMNASGLHDPRQITTARDMAKLAQYVINTYPDYYQFFSRQSFTYAGHTHRNHNRLLGSYAGMDGMKTGYIAASGFNLVASAVRDGHRIIGVVFGGRSTQSRNAHMVSLLDQGFAKVGAGDVRMASVNIPLPERKPAVAVTLANTDDVGTVLPDEFIEEAQQPAVLASLAPPTPSSFKGSIFTRMIGEGDSDPEISKRFETGLMAISAHKAENAATHPILAAYTPQDSGSGSSDKSWSIQVGAFKTRLQTDAALEQTRRKLPAVYASAFPVVAPLRTPAGWLFRARLTGYDRAQAFDACRYIRDCMPIAP